MKICKDGHDVTNDMKFCPECGKELEIQQRMILSRFFTHTSKEDMWSIGEGLGLNEKALETFQYAGYEMEFLIEVNDITGETLVVGIKASGGNLIKLTEKVKI